MKICARCGHINYTPKLCCEACKRIFNQAPAQYPEVGFKEYGRVPGGEVVAVGYRVRPHKSHNR